jgi:hypothetical protein
MRVHQPPVNDPNARCDLSDLPADQCGCRKHRPGLSIVDVEPAGTAHTYGYGNAFTAQYPGRCPECDERYEVGELIRAQQYKTVRSATGRYAHDDCAREA